jgi:hypothetical protein
MMRLIMNPHGVVNHLRALPPHPFACGEIHIGNTELETSYSWFYRVYLYDDFYPLVILVSYYYTEISRT